MGDADVRYGSVCSGIESASVAWEPLGWVPAWFSEIEPFASAVLAHRFPHVTNLGDMTAIAARIRAGEVEAPDVLVGGTPCQAFSVAGARAGLADPRGQLTLAYVDLANAIDSARSAAGKQPVVTVWENVTGVLSSKDNAFGCFLGALAGESCELKPAGGRWTDAGCVFGPERAVAWRVLDAQYFGLAQRRRRVFVVASARDGFDPATVLFEWEGVRRDSAPSRESGKVAPTIPSRSTGGGGLGTDFDCDGGLIARAVSLRGREGGGTAELGDDLQNCLRASGGGGDKPHVLIHADPIARCDTAGEAKRQDWEACNFVAHSLRGEGFDASEDGTGRGTPLVPVAFSCKDYGADAGEVAPTLRSMGHDKSHANAGGQVAIAFNARQDPDHWHDRTGPLDTDGSTQAVSYAIQAGALRTNPASGPDGVGVQADHAYTLEARAEVQAVAFQERGRKDGRSLEVGDDVAYALTAPNGGGRAQERNVLTPTMQVRRLTPTECERLQGFPDDYTRIPWKLGYWPADKHSADVRDAIAEQCPDGPRYKALGNSKAVPVVRWIGQRIDAALRGVAS